MIHAVVSCKCCGQVLLVDEDGFQLLCDRCSRFDAFEKENEGEFSLAYLVDEDEEMHELDDDDLWY